MTKFKEHEVVKLTHDFQIHGNGIVKEGSFAIVTDHIVSSSTHIKVEISIHGIVRCVNIEVNDLVSATKNEAIGYLSEVYIINPMGVVESIYTHDLVEIVLQRMLELRMAVYIAESLPSVCSHFEPYIDTERDLSFKFQNDFLMALAKESDALQPLKKERERDSE